MSIKAWGGGWLRALADMIPNNVIFFRMEEQSNIFSSWRERLKLTVEVKEKASLKYLNSQPYR